MTKHKVEKETETKNLDANRPIAGQVNRPVDDETLSHQWQKDSPAVDTNVLSNMASQPPSIIQQVEAANAKPEKLKEEYDTSYDCTKLDVSDNNYCQPGSDRHKAYLKANK